MTPFACPMQKNPTQVCGYSREKPKAEALSRDSTPKCQIGLPVVDQKPQFIDLFCGCGGFTLGMQRAGFQCLAAIDFNAEAIATLKANIPEVNHSLERDLTSFSPKDLETLMGTAHIDVIVGGPPCQGFSTARQRDGSNHGVRLKEDHRRHLYREFLRFVEHFQPKVFVIENVLGIRTAAGGEYFTRVQKDSRDLGYRVHGQIEDSWELGVPQKRRRQLIIGVRNDLHGYFPSELKPAPRAEPRTVLGSAIGDLPILRAGSGENERDYDLERRKKHLLNGDISAEKYLTKVLEIDVAKKLTNHIARPHSERDLRDFALLNEGENSATAMRDRGVEFEFPYDRSSFKDRYTRQSRQKPCSTIVAHLSKDGLMFIHPTQNRSLTPREAARIQSFPDWFEFPEARTHAFRLIGNAVPPLIAESVGLAIKAYLATIITPTMTSFNVADKKKRSLHGCNSKMAERGTGDQVSIRLTSIPRSPQSAERELQRFALLDRKALHALSAEDFLQGWHALLFLFPNLHPDNALDHSTDIETTKSTGVGEPDLENFLSKCYVRSGWPVALVRVGHEAWRRYEAGEITKDNFYCVEAQRAGLMVDKQKMVGA